MILGYILRQRHSNDANFFDGNEPSGVLCQNCGSCLDYNYYPKFIDINPSKKYDAVYTYDLRELFSESFFVFCRDVLKIGHIFKPIQTRGETLYYMSPTHVLEFDYIRRKTKFEKTCEQCGGYRDIVGATPAFLKNHKPVEAGFFRTDLAFGSGKSKSPLILLSSEWKKLLVSQKFKGIDFGEILD